MVYGVQTLDHAAAEITLRLARTVLVRQDCSQSIPQGLELGDLAVELLNLSFRQSPGSGDGGCRSSPPPQP